MRRTGAVDLRAVFQPSNLADATLAWAAAGGLAALCVILLCVIANRQKAFRSLREAERSFRELYNNIGEGVFRSTLDGRMISANPALVRLNGFASEADMLNEVNDIAGQWYVDPNRRAEIHAMLMREGRICGVVSEVYRYKTRERIWIEETTRLVRDPKSGLPRYYDGTVREVTETVRRLQLQERFEKISSVTDSVLYQHRIRADGSSQILYASPALAKMFGIDPKSVSEDASLLFTLVHPDDRDALAASYRRALATMSPRARSSTAFARPPGWSGGCRATRCRNSRRMARSCGTGPSPTSPSRRRPRGASTAWPISTR